MQTPSSGGSLSPTNCSPGGAKALFTGLCLHALLFALSASPFLIACAGEGGGPDGGGVDARVPTGEPCPAQGPDGCAAQICLTGRGGQNYCSEYCQAGACPSGFPCQETLFGDKGGAPADLRAVCSPACEGDNQCQSGVCEAAGICRTPSLGIVKEGEACGAADGVCEIGLVCVLANGAQRCTKVCDPDATPFCADGSFCFASNVPSGGRCWPGESASLGQSCQSHLECERGLLCILQNGESACRAGCDPSGVGPACSIGQCLLLADRSYGFCQG